MKRKMMEIVQTSADALPTVAAIPPIENSTSTGTPLATQNAPVQSILRWRPCAAPSALSGTAPASTVIDMSVPLPRHAPVTCSTSLQVQRCGGPKGSPHRECVNAQQHE